MIALWLALVILFAVVEFVTPQLVCIWFALGSVAALIVEFCGGKLWLQLVLFALVSAICIVASRPLYAKFINTKKVATNTDALIGAEAVVVDAIDNIEACGQVKCRGQIWSARSEDGAKIENGALVRVVRIEGVKLIVTK